MFRKKPKEEPKGYSFKPREYDRDEKIALQKIVSNIPVTRKLLSQDLIVKATYNFVAKNIKIGSAAAHNVNTTENPQIFFKSLEDLVTSTEELIKIEPYWRFEEKGPTEQLEEINEKRDKIIKGFLYESFTKLVEEIERTNSSSRKQKLFDEYQNGLLMYSETMGEENFEFFKTLCREKLEIKEN